MSARTPLEDAHRSVRRYVAGALGDTLAGEPWPVLMQESAVPDEGRPAAVVVQATPVNPLEFRTSIPQGDVRLGCSFVATAYPELAGEGGEPLTPSFAAQRAREIQTSLQMAFLLGMEDDEDGALSGPMEVPLYDYEGLDIETQGPEDPYGRLEVLDANVEAIADPQDDRRWSVPLAVRVAWWTPGRGWDGGPEPPVVKHMPPHFIAP